jgi:hypothetical protein
VGTSSGRIALVDVLEGKVSDEVGSNRRAFMHCVKCDGRFLRPLLEEKASPLPRHTYSTYFSTAFSLRLSAGTY